MEQLRNIQQNLWQTKLFIQNEAERLNKLQDEMKTPINKVNKVSWVINHKWRQLRTKRATAEELSEVDKYSQSLDKTKYFDAQEKIGTHASNYANFLKFLREKPSLVAVILLTDGTRRRQADELAELIHSLFSVLFGFAIFPTDEAKMVRVLGEVAKIQIAEYQGPISSFFSKQTAFSLCFRLFIEWSSSTRAFIGELMSDIVMNVLGEPEYLYVDEKRFAEKYPHIKNLMKIRKTVEHYRSRVAHHVICMITQIRRHLASFPPYLRWLGLLASQYFQTYRGSSQDEINIFLGDLFYTRMLFYPFIQPQIYLDNKVEVIEMGKFNLFQVTYSFREAFLSELGVPSSSSRIKYTTVLPHIGHHKLDMALLLEEIIEIPYSSTVLPNTDIPLQRSCVMITERHLHNVISILMEVLASGKFQPEEKELLATALSHLPSEPCRYLSSQKPRKRSTTSSNLDKTSRKNRPTLPYDDDLYEEEVIVFSLPDVTPDCVKTEREVLGINVHEVFFDERRMSVLAATTHPLDDTVQNEVKGRLLHDFDMLFHNPELEVPPDGVSIASSYDSSDKQPDTVSNIDLLTSVLEATDTSILSNPDTLTEGVDSLVLSSEDRTLESVSSPTGDSDSKTPEGEVEGDDVQNNDQNLVTPASSNTNPFLTSPDELNNSSFTTSESSCDSGSVLRVNLNEKSGGFSYESSSGSLSRVYSLSTLPRNSDEQNEGSTVLPHHNLPVDILTSDFPEQDIPRKEDNIVENAIRKLKISFSLSPHFNKTFYPKIGNGPPTTMDLISLSPGSGVTTLAVDDELISQHKSLLEYLYSEFAEASLHSKKNVIQIEQAIISVKNLPPEKVKYVLDKLREYNNSQSTYVQYLTERKCELLRTKEYLGRIQSILDLKQQSFYHTLASLVIQEFLKTYDKDFKVFKERFKEVLADEKIEVYNEYIDCVQEKMSEDVSLQTIAIDHSKCDERECRNDSCDGIENHQKEVMRFSEIHFFSHIYSYAFLPNGDAQKQRDIVFEDSLSELKKRASLDHPDIMIPTKYINEAPWEPAQKYLSLLACYRSPTGKLSCILNCVYIIFKLLFVGAAGDTILDGKTDDSSVPGADDLLPVLIYVIIHANPPHILSTIEFINNFTPKYITGQDNYMLMQFTCAVEFIKTMLHKQ